MKASETHDWVKALSYSRLSTDSPSDYGPEAHDLSQAGASSIDSLHPALKA